MLWDFCGYSLAYWYMDPFGYMADAFLLNLRLGLSMGMSSFMSKSADDTLSAGLDVGYEGLGEEAIRPRRRIATPDPALPIGR